MAASKGKIFENKYVRAWSYPTNTKNIRVLANQKKCACGVTDTACTKIVIEYRTYLREFES
jgi:hypothetical protein